MSNRIVADFHLLVKCLHRLYGVAVPALADVTVTSGYSLETDLIQSGKSGSSICQIEPQNYPLETDLIHSGKAILLADTVTRPGGTITVSSLPWWVVLCLTVKMLSAERRTVPSSDSSRTHDAAPVSRHTRASASQHSVLNIP